MKIYHEDLIPILPKIALNNLWDDCIEMLKTWRQIKYITDGPLSKFVWYTQQVFDEMRSRGYEPDFLLPIEALKARNVSEFKINQAYNHRWQAKPYMEHDEDKLYADLRDLIIDGKKALNESIELLGEGHEITIKKSQDLDVILNRMYQLGGGNK